MLDFGGNRITNLIDGVDPEDAITKSQLDNHKIDNADWNGADLAISNGGTGASNPSDARTNLGLVIGTDVQAHDPDILTTSNTKTLTNKTFDANGTGNSLSNIDVVDLADGTDGELITWDSTGAPATVSVGTSGQVLTSNGAGTAPTFQNARNVGAWEFISSTTASASASIAFTGLGSSFSQYMMVFDSCRPSATSAPYLQVSTDNGSSWQATNYRYTLVGADSNSPSATILGSASDTQIKLGGADVATTGNGFFGTVLIMDPSNSSQPLFGKVAVGYNTSGGQLHTREGSMEWLTTTVVDAVKFYFSTGNITDGTIYLYGLNKS